MGWNQYYEKNIQPFLQKKKQKRFTYKVWSEEAFLKKQHLHWHLKNSRVQPCEEAGRWGGSVVCKPSRKRCRKYKTTWQKRWSAFQKRWWSWDEFNEISRGLINQAFSGYCKKLIFIIYAMESHQRGFQKGNSLAWFS